MFAASLKSTSSHGKPTSKGSKTQDARKLQAHIERTGNYELQNNVDSSRTAQNIQLDDFDPEMSYDDRFQVLKAKNGYAKNFEREKSYIKSFVLTASQEEFDKMDKDTQIACLKRMVELVGDEFGMENMIYGEIHMDETTPHVHVGFVPINPETGKVRFDSVGDKKWLREKLHTEIPETLKKEGYPIEKPTRKFIERIENSEYDKYLQAVNDWTDERKKQAEQEIQDDFVPNLKRKYNKQVKNIAQDDLDERIAQNKAKMDALRANQEAEAERFRASQEALRKQQEALQAEIDKQEEEKAKQAEALAEGSERLSKLNSEVKDAKVLAQGKNALRSFIRDLGYPLPMANALASGETLPYKNKPGGIDASVAITQGLARQSNDEVKQRLLEAKSMNKSARQRANLRIKPKSDDGPEL